MINQQSKTADKAIDSEMVSFLRACPPRLRFVYFYSEISNDYVYAQFQIEFYLVAQ